MPGYADKAVGIEKLGLPSLPIPELFLAEKISLFPVQHTADRGGIPSPPTSPGPPGLVHPSRQTAIPQSLRESCFTPIRRGSDPGIFSRSVVEGAVSYKSAVQGKALCGGDGYAKVAVSSTKWSPPSSQIDGSEATGMVVGSHGSPLRRINPKIVESIEPLCSPWR